MWKQLFLIRVLYLFYTADKIIAIKKITFEIYTFVINMQAN